MAHGGLHFGDLWAKTIILSSSIIKSLYGQNRRIVESYCWKKVLFGIGSGCIMGKREQRGNVP